MELYDTIGQSISKYVSNKEQVTLTLDYKDKILTMVPRKSNTLFTRID